MRKIDDILHFRNDISPFLIHLTRDDEKLSSILNNSYLIPGPDFMSSIAYGLTWSDLGVEKRLMLRAVSFTETPLSEVNSLIEIAKRNIPLSNFGLVFIKESLKRVGVSPVFYLNNHLEDHADTLEALQTFINNYPIVGKKLLPLFSHFGKTTKGNLKKIDFSWEREWRYPAAYGNFEFSPKDIFVGLCPTEKIADFEDRYGKKFAIGNEHLKFIDPIKPSRWYATKLVQSRKRIGMEYSVV